MAMTSVWLDRDPIGPWPMIDARTGEVADGTVVLLVARSGAWIFLLFGWAAYLLARVVRAPDTRLEIPMTRSRLQRYREAQRTAWVLIVGGIAGLSVAIVAGGAAPLAWASVPLLLVGILVRGVNRGVQLPSARLDSNRVELLGVHPRFAAAIADLYP
jgi:hypothetical protein